MKLSSLKKKLPSLPKHWYAKKPVIVTSLIVFFPVGLFLMWKFANWTKKTKWIISGIIALLIVIGFVSSYYSPPTITVASAENSKISTDNEEHMLTGKVYSMKNASLSINDQPVALSEDGNFTYKAILEEGDNDFNLAATNDNGLAKEVVTIHRTTQAEFAARAEAERLEAEKIAREENEKRAADSAEEAATRQSDEDAKKRIEEADRLKDEEERIKQEEAARQQAEAERIAQEEAKNIDTNELVALREVAKNAILLVLKAPSSAEFAGDGFWNDPLQGWQYGWATDYDEVYYLTSYVDSENSFGAMLRSQFQVGFKMSGESYNVVFVYFDGKVLLDNR